MSCATDLCRLQRRTAALALALALGWALPALASDLLSVRFGASSKDATRIVFDLSGSVDYAISGADQGQGRISVDFKGLSAKNLTAAGTGHVGRYATREADAAGVAQAVLDLARTARIKDHFLLAPKGDVRVWRLVIDLESADKAAFLASLPPRYEDLAPVLEAVTRPTDSASSADALYTIVIDPGHGGSDPGAASSKGVAEKTVTLAAALKLAEILQAKGRYRVVLTRADDTRLSLEQRSKAAREAGAELFISMHADAHDDTKVRGGSVYTLSEEGTQRSAREAKAQGDYTVYDGNINEHTPEVGGILFDLAQRETKNNSALFADLLLKSVSDATPLLHNSHRTADLFVLLAPDVPAVLFELAFISNNADAANLTSPVWRERAMNAVADAIDRYFDNRKSSRHAANTAAPPRQPADF